MFNADCTDILLEGEFLNVQNETEIPLCFSDVCTEMPSKSENKKKKKKRRFLSMLQSSS